MKTSLTACRPRFAPRYLLALPLAGLLFAACGDGDSTDDLGSGGDGAGGEGARASGGANVSAGGANVSAGGANVSAAGADGTNGGTTGSEGGAFTGTGGGSADGEYAGPTVGRAKTFAVLAYSAITTANISKITGELGVSAGAVSKITGFDAPTYTKYGINSLAPHSQRTILAQMDVTALTGDIDPRPCDTDLTNVVGGLTGDITLSPGVTCMKSFSADVLVNGHVYLDAGNDPNAFFIIRGNLTLTVADAAQVVLMNGAQACSVFWRFAKAVTIGKTVDFYGTVVAGTAITLKSGSSLTGRALAQTAGVQLDANSVTIPSAADCSHVQ